MLGNVAFGCHSVCLSMGTKEVKFLYTMPFGVCRQRKFINIVPALKYCNYAIINELEASKLTGIEPTNENLKRISEKLMELGVKEKVIIHKPDLSTALSAEGFTALPSFDIPQSDIVGTTGAGDAFCAGSLIGIYDELSDKEILELASSVALVSLFASDATSGVVDEEQIKNFCKNKDRKKICL